MPNRAVGAFRRWSRDPTSWLSVIATLVSIITFVLVYAWPGELKVVLPVQVGLKTEGGQLKLLLPVTFTNTGAPSIRRHIVTLRAELHDREQPHIQPVVLRWESEWRFVGVLEFNKKYLDQADPGVEDYIEYVSRAVPFAIAGGQSTSKVMFLKQRPGAVGDSGFRSFELNVIAKTEGKQFTQAARFNCKTKAQSARFDWCQKEEEGD
jgi:hypothetical protein